MKRQFYEEFSVKDLESRLEMKRWISIEVGPCDCDDGHEIL